LPPPHLRETPSTLLPSFAFFPPTHPLAWPAVLHCDSFDGLCSCSALSPFRRWRSCFSWLGLASTLRSPLSALRSISLPPRLSFSVSAAFAPGRRQLAPLPLSGHFPSPAPSALILPRRHFLATVARPPTQWPEPGASRARRTTTAVPRDRLSLRFRVRVTKTGLQKK
jgi:hypothetical protein